MAQKAPIVIDNGTGYTKLGYSGNVEPQYIIPTVIGNLTIIYKNVYSY